MADERPICKTADLGFAAFLKAHGSVLDSIRRKDRTHFEFHFKIDLDEWSNLNIRWSNSLERRFDDEIRDLKKLCSRVPA